MTIEFADPGYNWLPIWTGLAIVVLGIVAMILLYPALDDAVAPIGLFPMMAIVFAPIIGSLVYGNAVSDDTTNELMRSGFSNVQLVGDRFTAATEDGKYFEGVLVDLRPDEGYAYEVLELNRTGD